LAQTSSRLSAARPANTSRQPNAAPISPPVEAPKESDISSPETAIDSQVARCSGGALPLISA